MYTKSTRFALVLVILATMPLELFSQSAEARAAREELAKMSAEARFASAAIDEAVKLASADDALWLLGELAGIARVAEDRKALFIARASILELAGNYREAASSWEAAARAVPGIADAKALLSAAACRLAAGEADAASGLATALSFSSPDPVTASLAKVDSRMVSAFRGRLGRRSRERFSLDRGS